MRPVLAALLLCFGSCSTAHSIVPQVQLPSWAEQMWLTLSRSSNLQLSTRLNPCMWRGDFNGDGRADLALLVTQMKDARLGHSWRVRCPHHCEPAKRLVPSGRPGSAHGITQAPKFAVIAAGVCLAPGPRAIRPDNGASGCTLQPHRRQTTRQGICGKAWDQHGSRRTGTPTEMRQTAIGETVRRHFPWS